MTSTRNDPVTIDSLQRLEDMDTALAYAFEEKGTEGFDEDREIIWLPRSHTEFDGDDVIIPEWLAYEKGLI